MLIANGSRKPDQYVQGDAPVLSIGDASFSGSTSARTRALREPRFRAGVPGRRASRSTRHDEDRSVKNDQGLYDKNRKGVEICRAWNAGVCSGTARCPASRSHQCSKCLQTAHPVTMCGDPSREKAGKGRSKGKKGGKADPQL